MADQQDRNHHQQPHHDSRALGHEARRQRVEHQRQHAARKSDGEQTDVGEHVAEQSRDIIIQVPQPRAEIDERVAFRIVQQ